MTQPSCCAFSLKLLAAYTRVSLIAAVCDFIALRLPYRRIPQTVQELDEKTGRICRGYAHV